MGRLASASAPQSYLDHSYHPYVSYFVAAAVVYATVTVAVAAVVVEIATAGVGANQVQNGCTARAISAP